MRAQNSFATLGVVKISERISKAGLADFQAKVLPGDIFGGVRFVENHQIILRQVIHTGHAEGEVGKEQGVIDDEHIAAVHAAFGGLPDAFFIKRASLAETVAVFGADFIPHIQFGEIRQIGQRTIGGVLGPFFNRPERLFLALVLKQIILSAARLLESALTEVVVAAFDEHRREFIGIDGLEQRDVFFRSTAPAMKSCAWR